MIEHIEKLPVVFGLYSIFSDKKDVRRQLTLGIFGLLLIMIVAEALGYSGGKTFESIRIALIVIIAYWFGQKETEQRV